MRLIIISLSVLSVLLVGLTALSILHLNEIQRSCDSYISTNHYLADLEFLRNLNDNKIVLYRVSEMNDNEFKVENWVICIRSLKTQNTGKELAKEMREGMENYVFHNNKFALLFSCHLILNGKGGVGIKTIEALEDVSPRNTYFYQRDKYVNTSQMREISQKYINGDRSQETLIGAIEQQYQFAANKFRWVLSEKLKRQLRFGEPKYIE